MTEDGDVEVVPTRFKFRFSSIQTYEFIRQKYQAFFTGTVNFDDSDGTDPVLFLYNNILWKQYGLLRP